MPASQRQQSSRIPELGSIQSLLNEKEYELAAEKLYKAQQLANKEGTTGLASLLFAAYQICLTCQQQQQNVLMYHEVYENSVIQEADFRQQLDQLLRVCMEEETAVTPHTFKSQTHLSAAPPSFWQRVRAWLGQTTIPDVEPAPEIAEPISQMAVSPRAVALVKPILKTVVTAPEPKRTPPPDDESDDKTAVSSTLPTPEAALTIYCLGTFRVYFDDQPVSNWPSGKGKSIFKYLVVHRQQPVAKEVLMDTFWQDADPDAARNNLNVAIYGLRQAFRHIHPNSSFVLFQNGAYSLNSELQVWVDSESFQEAFTTGKKLENQGNIESAMRSYRAAEILYQGEFLAEDRYEEWLLPHRQKMEEDYLFLLERLSSFYLDHKDYDTCINICGKIIDVEPCQEAAHCRLMRCFYRQGQPYLALRQYHQCIESLKNELSATPTPKTVELYQRIRHHQPL